jgi:hypothetical protein
VTLLAAAVDPRAPGLRDEQQWAPEIGDGGAAVGDGLAGAVELGEAALDPWTQLANGRGRVALGGAAREHDLDSECRIDGDADATRALGAPDPVGDRIGRSVADDAGGRSGDFLHAAKGYGGLPTCP